jgi:hypothetical protein
MESAKTASKQIICSLSIDGLPEQGLRSSLYQPRGVIEPRFGMMRRSDLAGSFNRPDQSRLSPLQDVVQLLSLGDLLADTHEDGVRS